MIKNYKMRKKKVVIFFKWANKININIFYYY